MLFDAKKLTLDEARSMVSQLTYSDIIDKFIGEVVCNHKYADILAEEWSVSNKDNLGRAGWNLIVHKVSDGKLTNAALEELLTRIEAELKIATPGKQWAMNHGLCEIGIRYPQFTERCITLGETLGVYRDLKVSKGCTSAYAPNWIAKGISMEKRVHPDLRKMFSVMPAQSDSFNEENLYEIRKNLDAMIIRKQ